MTPFFSKITDMQILPSEAPISANLGTLMRTVYQFECRDRGPHHPNRSKRSHTGYLNPLPLDPACDL